MKNLTQRYSFLRIWIAIAVSYLLLMVNANAASLEIHPSVLTALGKRPSFADKMIVIDDVGKGGVDYEFMVSQTQITVQDWVDFLNVVDPGNSKGLGLADSNNPHHHPYQYSGNWQVKSAFDPGGGFSYSRAVTAKLPIDKLSLNQVARYMNWLATGSIANGAFTFSGSSGNSRITAFDSNFPGARLPLDVDMVKAMYWDKSLGRFRTYPNGSDSAPSAANISGSGTYASSKALYGCWSGNSNYCWAQVGQEGMSGSPRNAWGLLDVAGNRHETTLQPSNLTGIIVRGASAYTPISWSKFGFSDTSFSANQYLMSVGYRVWAGVPKKSGKIAIKKVVSGGSDATRQFSFNLDCDGTLYDKSGILLKHNETFTSVSIPQYTKCTVTETPPSGAPSGYTYGVPQYSMVQPVTIGDNTSQTVTVTNTLTPQTTDDSCPVSETLVSDSYEWNGVARFAIQPTYPGVCIEYGKDHPKPGMTYK